jgi:prepilin-type processing-associated H-X9-DG protein
MDHARNELPRTDRRPRRQYPLVFLLLLTAGCACVMAATQTWGNVGLVIGAVLLAEALIIWRVRQRLDAAMRFAVLDIVVVMVFLLLRPGLPTARSGRRTDCANKLRNVALALLLYHDAHGQLPPAYTVDTKGNRLHSWRSLILPYMECTNLYEAIDFDEPWDSEHNSSLHGIAVPIFQCPKEGQFSVYTDYVVVVGPETLFPDSQSVAFDDVADGVTNTIMVVEVANSGIHWMEPRDLHVTQMSTVINPRQGQGISSRHGGGANVAFAGCAVIHLGAATAPDRLRAYLTIDGGEPMFAE